MEHPGRHGKEGFPAEGAGRQVRQGFPVEDAGRQVKEGVLWEVVFVLISEGW